MSRRASGCIFAVVAAVMLAGLGAGCAGAASEPPAVVAPSAAAPLPEAVRRTRMAPEIYALYTLRMQLGIDDEPLILASP